MCLTPAQLAEKSGSPAALAESPEIVRLETLRQAITHCLDVQEKTVLASTTTLGTLRAVLGSLYRLPLFGVKRRVLETCRCIGIRDAKEPEGLLVAIADKSISTRRYRDSAASDRPSTRRPIVCRLSAQDWQLLVRC